MKDLNLKYFLKVYTVLMAFVTFAAVAYVFIQPNIFTEAQENSNQNIATQSLADPGFTVQCLSDSGQSPQEFCEPGFGFSQNPAIYQMIGKLNGNDECDFYDACAPEVQEGDDCQGLTRLSCGENSRGEFVGCNYEIENEPRNCFCKNPGVTYEENGEFECQGTDIRETITYDGTIECFEDTQPNGYYDSCGARETYPDPEPEECPDIDPVFVINEKLYIGEENNRFPLSDVNEGVDAFQFSYTLNGGQSFGGDFSEGIIELSTPYRTDPIEYSNPNLAGWTETVPKTDANLYTTGIYTLSAKLSSTDEVCETIQVEIYDDEVQCPYEQLDIEYAESGDPDNPYISDPNSLDWQCGESKTFFLRATDENENDVSNDEGLNIYTRKTNSVRENSGIIQLNENDTEFVAGIETPFDESRCNITETVTCTPDDPGFCPYAFPDDQSKRGVGIQISKDGGSTWSRDTSNIACGSSVQVRAVENLDATNNIELISGDDENIDFFFDDGVNKVDLDNFVNIVNITENITYSYSIENIGGLSDPFYQCEDQLDLICEPEQAICPFEEVGFAYSTNDGTTWDGIKGGELQVQCNQDITIRGVQNINGALGSESNRLEDPGEFIILSNNNELEPDSEVTFTPLEGSTYEYAINTPSFPNDDQCKSNLTVTCETEIPMCPYGPNDLQILYSQNNGQTWINRTELEQSLFCGESLRVSLQDQNNNILDNGRLEINGVQFNSTDVELDTNATDPNTIVTGEVLRENGQEFNDPEENCDVQSSFACETNMCPYEQLDIRVRVAGEDDDLDLQGGEKFQCGDDLDIRVVDTADNEIPGSDVRTFFSEIGGDTDIRIENDDRVSTSTEFERYGVRTQAYRNGEPIAEEACYDYTAIECENPFPQCYEPCTTDDECGSGLVCQDVDGKGDTRLCVNPKYPNERTCSLDYIIDKQIVSSNKSFEYKVTMRNGSENTTFTEVPFRDEYDPSQLRFDTNFGIRGYRVFADGDRSPTVNITAYDTTAVGSKDRITINDLSVPLGDLQPGERYVLMMNFIPTATSMSICNEAFWNPNDYGFKMDRVCTGIEIEVPDTDI